MPSKGLVFNGQKYARLHLDTTDYGDNYNDKKVVFKQVGLRPTSALRRNNPHPRSDFLMPKNIVEMDGQQKFQANIHNAVRSYLGKLYQTGNTTNPQLAEIIRRTLGDNAKASCPSPPEVRTPVMPESEMMENYVNPTEDELERIMADDKKLLKREQGNSDKKAGKIYHKIADEKEQLSLQRSSKDQTYKTLYQRISRTPQLPKQVSGNILQWPNAHPPTPGKRGLHESLPAAYEARYSQSKLPATKPSSASAKRIHTPPTPPDRGRRVKSAAYESQLRSMRRSKSLPPTPRSTSVSPQLLQKITPSDHDDMTSEQLPPNTPDEQRRPKTAGPVLANSMVAHPRMKAWIDSATPYEKEVALSLLGTLSGRKPTDEKFQQLEAKLNCNPSRKTWSDSISKPTIPPATHTFDAYIPPSPAPVTPVPDRNGKDDRTTKDWMKKVEATINDRMTPQEQDRSMIHVLPRGRPLARHQYRPQMLQEYRHDNSFFTFTNKGPTKQFTIAPDWVSERLKPQRPKKHSNEQLRYGSK